MAMFTLGYNEVPIEEEIVNLIRWESERLKLESCCDVFGEEEPWRLFDKDVARVHYVFVDLKKRNQDNKGVRVRRTAGADGFWKCNSCRKEVRDSNGKLIGYKKTRVFEPRIEENGVWMMHEYSTLEFKEDYLICAIKNRALQPPPIVRQYDDDGNCIIPPRPNTDEWAIIEQYSYNPGGEWQEEYNTIMRNIDTAPLIKFNG